MKTASRCRSFVRACASAAAAVWLVASLPAGAQTEPLTINIIINQTGSNAFVGQDYIETIKVFEAYLNKRRHSRAARPFRAL